MGNNVAPAWAVGEGLHVELEGNGRDDFVVVGSPLQRSVECPGDFGFGDLHGRGHRAPAFHDDGAVGE